MAARSSKFLLFFFLATITISCSQGRKLLQTPSPADQSYKVAVPTLQDMRFFFNALPKGKVPASAPTKKGHAVTIDQKLIARHLAAIDRILGSVPSPGVGH